MPQITNLINKYGRKAISTGYDIFHELAHKIGIAEEAKADIFALRNLTNFYNQATGEVVEPTEEVAGVEKRLEREPPPVTLLTAQGKSLQEIGDKLATGLGTLIKEGRVYGRRLGFYRIKEKLVRVRSNLDLATVMHELGHHIDLSLTKVKKRGFADELEFLARGRAQKSREGFANFISYYIINPGYIKINTPEFYNYFTEEFPRVNETNKAIKEMLDVARKDYLQWREMPASAQIKSMIGVKIPPVERVTIRSIMQHYFDRWVTLKDYVAEAKKAGLSIPSGINAYLRAVGAAGMGGKVEQCLFGKIFKIQEDGKSFVYEEDGIGKIFNDASKNLKVRLKEINKTGIDFLQDMEAYFAAKRGEVYRKRGIQFIEEFTPETGKEAIGEIENTYGMDLVREIDTKIQETFRRILKIYREEGRLSSEDFDNIMKSNWYYIPMERILEGIAGGISTRAILTSKNPIKMIKGGEQAIQSPIQGMIEASIKLPVFLEQQAIKKGIVYLKQAGGDLDRAIEPIAKKTVPVARVKKKVSPLQAIFGEGEAETETIFRPVYKPEGAVIDLWIDGKQVWYEIPRDLYDSMQQMNNLSGNLVTSILKGYADIMKFGATVTAEFTGGNVFRDYFESWSLSKYGINPVMVMKGWAHYLKRDELFNEWQRSGADIGFFIEVLKPDYQRLIKAYEQDPDAYYKKLNKILLERDKKLYIEYLNPLKTMREIAKLSEAGTRIGGFEVALEKTKDSIEAMYEGSRHLSIDFSQSAGNPFFRNYVFPSYAFLNPALQGKIRLGRAFKERPLRTLVRTSISTLAPTIILSFINRDDDDYHELPSWRRILCYNIPLKYTRIKALEGRFLSPPKAPDIALISGLFESFLDYWYEKDSQDFTRMFNEIVTSASPISNTAELLPNALRGIMEVKTGSLGYSHFFQRPIIPKAKEFYPPEEQYGRYTSEFMKQLGALGKLSPAKIEYLFLSLTAGMGKYFLGINDFLIDQYKKLKGEPVKPTPDISRRFFIRKFLTERPTGTASETLRKFYDRWEDVTRLENKAKILIKETRTEELEAFLKEHPSFMSYDRKTKTYFSPLARRMRRQARWISERVKEEDIIRRHPTMTADEKRDRIKAMDEKILGVIKENK